MISSVKGEIGDYHVIIKGDNIEDDSILKNNYKDNRNYISYKEIGRVYKNTNKICDKNKCEAITYNDSLLSLYGLSKNKNVLNVFKKFLYFFIFFFGIIVFIILYNAFSVSAGTKRKNYILYKFAGSDNGYLFKMHFVQLIKISFISVLFGFIISIFLNYFLISFINSCLYEVFGGKLVLSIYYSFLIIPIIFMFLIIIICGLFPFKKIRKYKVMEIFRDSNEVLKSNISLKSNIILYLFKINIFRLKKKYRNLIICIFIFCFSFNIIYLVFSYAFKCLDNYVIIPNYDLSISVSGDYNFKNIIRKFDSNKKNEFHSCYMETFIPKDYYNKYDNDNVIFTDLGGNEVINNVEIIGRKNHKISHLKYKRFNRFDKLDIEGYVIDNIKLTNKNYFGLEGNDTVINLNEGDFKNVCPEYNSNLILKTDYDGIDDYLNNLIRKEKIKMSYLNVKKTKEIINNLILVFKILFYFSSILILLILFSLSFNVSFFSIYSRRREFATLRSIGLNLKKIITSLLLESFYISFMGFLFSVPFVFVINKYLYMGIKRVFDFGKIIINYESFFISFFLSLLLTFISFVLSYLLVNKKSLIENIRYGSFT